MKNIKKGFTLIELLIVIAIIGILAVAFLPSVMDAPAKARDAQRIEQIGKIADFFMLNYATNGTVPAEWTLLKPSLENESNTLITDNLASFSGVFPTAPDSGGVSDSYYYYSSITSPSSNGYVALVFAELENAASGNVDTEDAINARNFMWTGIGQLGGSGKFYVVPIQK